MKNKIKAIVSERTIVLHYQDKKVNIQKQTDAELFEEVRELIDNGDSETLIERFDDISEQVSRFSNNLVEFEDGKFYLKGSDTPIPSAIVKKLHELAADRQDFLPLIRFWKKLAQNPSVNSREQLYGFMIANKIPLTEQGDIVVEKGVDQKRGGLPGELVDTHSGTVDNSVGMVVEMLREKVVDNPNQTCSAGLHVAAPDYVRNHWHGRIILECVVNPKDVVSVPIDYNNTKMRVCRYQVMGYSPKNTRSQQVVKLDDFLRTPDVETAKELEIGVLQGRDTDEWKDEQYKENKVKSLKMPESQQVIKGNPYADEIDGMTAKAIVEHVKAKTGYEITLSLKNKQGIAKKAIEVLEQADAVKELVAFTGETKGEKGPWNVIAVQMTDAQREAAVQHMMGYIKEGTGDDEKDARAIVNTNTEPVVLFDGVSKRFAKSQVDKLVGLGVDAEMAKRDEVQETIETVTVAEKVIDFRNLSANEIVNAVKMKFNESIESGAKEEVIERATPFFKNAGYTIKQ